MADLTAECLQRIQAQPPDSLDLGADSIRPAYHGLSLLNVPASLCRWLGAEPLAHSPLDLPVLDDLVEGARQVLVVLVDAVGLRRFQRWIDGRAASLNPLLSHGHLAALTSVVPSTTSAALTSFWTGRSPAEHGVLGYEIFLKEWGIITNMITHAPAVFDGRAGLLYTAGFDPERFLPVPTLGPRFRAAGIETHGFLHYSISGSGLSRMHYADVSLHTFAGVPDLWVGVRHLLATPIARPRLVWVYYGGVDGLSHRHGPDSEQAEVAFAAFAQAMVHECLDQLPAIVARETVLLLLSDHGQVATPLNAHMELRNHPDFLRLLYMYPTGENRLAYLYPKPQRAGDIRAYLNQAWPGAFTPLQAPSALEQGLFGPGEPAAVAADRLGEMILVSHGEAYLWWAQKENPLLGRHGGLSPDEMLVPLLASRLD